MYISLVSMCSFLLSVQISERVPMRIPGQQNRLPAPHVCCKRWLMGIRGPYTEVVLVFFGFLTDCPSLMDWKKLKDATTKSSALYELYPSILYIIESRPGKASKSLNLTWFSLVSSSHKQGIFGTSYLTPPCMACRAPVDPLYFVNLRWSNFNRIGGLHWMCVDIS